MKLGKQLAESDVAKSTCENRRGDRSLRRRTPRGRGGTFGLSKTVKVAVRDTLTDMEREELLKESSILCHVWGMWGITLLCGVE